MKGHEITREHAGRNEMRSIRPVCSCGWRGIARYAYEDYQHVLVREDIAQHLRAVTERNGEGRQ